VLALAVAACTSGPGTGSTSSPGTGAVASDPRSVSQGAAGGGASGGSVEVPAILDFEAPLVGGGTLRGADLAGAPVAVWFWAPW
jgi:hypothetical protein